MQTEPPLQVALLGTSLFAKLTHVPLLYSNPNLINAWQPASQFGSIWHKSMPQFQVPANIHISKLSGGKTPSMKEDCLLMPLYTHWLPFACWFPVLICVLTCHVSATWLEDDTVNIGRAVKHLSKDVVIRFTGNSFHLVALKLKYICYLLLHVSQRQSVICTQTHWTEVMLESGKEGGAMFHVKNLMMSLISFMSSLLQSIFIRVPSVMIATVQAWMGESPRSLSY